MSESVSSPPRATCRGCGKDILWGVMDGKKIPLDPRPPVYTVNKLDDAGNVDGTVAVFRHRECYVSHFATCSHASEFSGRNK